MPDPTPEFEQRIRTGLVDLVASAPDAPSRHAAIDARVAHYDRRFVQRRRLVAGTAATALVGGGLTWALNRRGDATGPQDVTVGPTPSTNQDEPTGWQSIDAAPLSPRTTPAAVWAGDRLIVWSGMVYGGPDHLLHPDGASWAPASASWRTIAPAPAGAIGGGFAVWDGNEILVGLTEGDSEAPWNDLGSEANALNGIAAYMPSTDAWRYVAPIAADKNERLRSARQAVVVDDGLLVAVRPALPGAPGHEGDIVLINVATGERTVVDPGPFSASPYPDASGDVTLTAVGSLVVATPNWDLRPWILDPATWSWRQASAPPTASSLHLLPATAAGDRAIFFESSGLSPWMFDPTADGPDAWQPGSPDPFPYALWRYDPVWGGTELFIPGAAYSPTADGWREVTPPPRGKDRQRTLQSRWTGDALLLFGGEEYTCPDGALCDRSAGPDTLDGWILTDP